MLDVLGITESEREELANSLDFLQGKLEILVERFYQNFLESKAGILFKNTDMDRQQIMFHQSIGVIITHIQYPEMLELHLNNIIAKHSHYGVLAVHIDDFIDSFYRALKDVFPDEADAHNVELWYKLINSVMLYFKNQIH